MGWLMFTLSLRTEEKPCRKQVKKLALTLHFLARQCADVLSEGDCATWGGD